MKARLRKATRRQTGSRKSWGRPNTAVHHAAAELVAIRKRGGNDLSGVWWSELLGPEIALEKVEEVGVEEVGG
jgi:hypothetical protein